MRQEDMEQFAFLYLCGSRDRALLSGTEKMTFSDFDRLIYITSFLGLIHFNLKMWNQYSIRFQKQLRILELLSEERSVPMEAAEYEDDIRRQEQWLTEFCSNAPDQGAQEYLRNFVEKEAE